MALLNTLRNFSVPTPNGVQNETLLMPKLQYRFRILFSNFGVSSGVSEITKQVISCGRPTPEFDPIVLDMYNSRINLLGKPKWGTLELVVRDDATNAVSRRVGEQIQKQFNFYEQSSAAAGIDYKFVMEVQILDGQNGGGGFGGGAPGILENFQLLGCQITKATYKNLEYKTSEAVDITMTIQYDNALQVDEADNPVGIGVGVARLNGVVSTGVSRLGEQTGL